jgi:hypothetical protein
VALAAAVAASVGDDGQRVRTTDEPVTPPAGELPPRHSGDPFPHLLLDLPSDWQITRADERNEPADGSEPPSGWRTQVFRHPAKGFDGPMLTVISVPRPDDYGVGDGTAVDVNGQAGVLDASNPFHATLSWVTSRGTRVVIRAVRVGGEELVAVARGLRLRRGGDGWDASVLPDGLKPVFDGGPEAPIRFHEAEVEFDSEAGRFDLSMNEGGPYDFEALVEDRVASADQLRGVEVLGVTAALTRYESSQRYSAMWFADGVVYELNGTVRSEDAFLDAVGSLRVVDDETWAAHLPESAVGPDLRPALVDGMLAGLPLPNGFDAQTLRQGEETSDVYQLGAAVAGAVACGWIDQLASARERGDAAASDEAVRALASSRSWPVLQEMNAEGDYPEVLWDFADRIVDGDTEAVNEAPSALGCER